MKPRDPALELQIRELARRARAGATMQPSDELPIFRRLLQRLTWILFLPIYLQLHSAYPVLGQSKGWQRVMIGVLLMLVAGQIFQYVRETLFAQGLYGGLVHLPISGHEAFSRLRKKTLRHFFLLVLGAAVATGLYVFGNDPSPWVRGILFVLQMTAVLYATAILKEHSLVQKVGLPWIWRLLSSVAFVFLVGVWLGHRVEWVSSLFQVETGDMLPALDAWFARLSWLLPPCWLLPGAGQTFGSVLALLWVVVGFLAWWAWPHEMARSLDEDRDYLPTYELEDEVGPEDDERAYLEAVENGQETSAEEAPSPDDKLEANVQQKVMKPRTLPEVRWVEKVMLWGLNARDRSVFALFTSTSERWTQRTHRAWLGIGVLLLVGWGLQKLPDSLQGFRPLAAYVFLLAVVFLFSRLAPLSNAIPNALAPWLMGSQWAPIFAPLPISTRELLRISCRVTGVRWVIFALTAMVMTAVVGPSLQGDLPLSRRVLFILYAVLLAHFQRPVFVWARLKAVAKVRRSGQWHHSVQLVLTILLLMTWMITLSYAAVALFPLMDSHAKLSWVWMSSGWVVSAVAARLVLEQLLWRIKRGHYDLLKGVQE